MSTPTPTPTPTSTSTSTWVPLPAATGIAPPLAAGAAAGTPADRWRAAVEQVEKVSPRVAPALKEAVLLSLADGEIAVQLPAGILADTVERRRAEIEAALARFFGRPTRLAVRTGAAAPEATTAAPLPPEAVPSIAQTEAAERRARSTRRQGTARSHPNIQEAARILDGGIEDVEEL